MSFDKDFEMERKVALKVQLGRTDPDTGEIVADPLRYEYPDPVPVVLEVDGEVTPSTLAAIMAQAHRLRERLTIDETFEESDDFDVDGDIPDYGTTRWEHEADAAKLTPEELFQHVYGISREDAQAKLAALRAKLDAPEATATDKPSA